MQPGMKAVVAVLVVALIAVIGLIVMSQGNSAQKPAPTVTATPETTAALEQEPKATAELAQGDDAAQDTMYEGALAGLTEESPRWRSPKRNPAKGKAISGRRIPLTDGQASSPA
mgnify:CR=1 FL=1